MAERHSRARKDSRRLSTEVMSCTTSAAGPRNGMPEPRDYTWRQADAERDAEIAAQLAAIRAEALRRNEASDG